MGTFLRASATKKRVRVQLPFPLPTDCIYGVVASNGPSLRITVDGRDGLVMAPDGSVAINLKLLGAKIEEAPSRWAGFDPEELETMRTAVSARHRAKTAELMMAGKNDPEIARLDRLWAELYEEINTRQGIYPPYAGQEEENLVERLTKMADDLETRQPMLEDVVLDLRNAAKLLSEGER